MAATPERDVSKVLGKYDFFDSATMHWPFDMYREMRRSAPVCRVDDPGTGRPVWMVTPYDLCQQVFRNSDDYSNRHAAVLFAGSGHKPEVEAELARGSREMDTFDSDPPGHARYRTLANKAFSPSAISKLTRFIARITDDLIDSFIERGECDFHREFSIQLPIYAMIGILGVEPGLASKFHCWADSYGVMMARTGTLEEEVRAARSIVEFQTFVGDLIARRRAQAQDDILSALIDAEDEGEARFTDAELLSMIRQFMLAGSETSRNALTMALGLLLRNPNQMAHFRRDPSMIGAVIDETLRYQTPVGGIWRIVRRDHELAGVQLREGDILMIRMDSANHDETVFDRPDKFDITRDNLRMHVAFGQGIHFCLGAMLARKELNVALPRLIERLRNMEIIEERTDLRVQPSILLRAPGGLSIRFEPAGRVGQGLGTG